MWGPIVAMVAASAALGIAAAALWSKRPLVGAILVVACALTGAGTIGFAAWQVWRWETLPVVDVSSVGAGPNFRLEVPHARVVATGDTNHFRPKVSDDELLDLLATQFPQGAADGYRFTVIVEGVRYHVDRQDDGTWIASRESVTVAEDNKLASIAFPEAALPGRLLEIGVPTSLATDPGAVVDELVLLGAARDADGAYVMPSREGPVRLTFEGDHVTASWG